MSYTPTNWQTGDTITAAGLNKMENGIEAASEVYVINLYTDANGYYLDNAEARTLFADILPQYGKPMCFALLLSGDIYPVSIRYFAIDGEVNVERIEVWNDVVEKIIFVRASIPDTGNFYGEVNNGVFTVTLTPTAQDFSGTMDKTPAEIGAAISAGQRIMFDFPSLSASVEATQFVSGIVACANITYDISGQDVLIQIVTSASDSTYSTKIFPLTPMS